MNFSDLKQKLASLDNDQLLSLISDESPEVIAVILSALTPQRAAFVLSYLSPQDKVVVSKRIATLKDLSPLVLEAVLRRIEQKFGK